jgi:predicted nucleic acid-binding protein
MLDTNIVSELARNPHGPIAKRIAEVGPDGICVSIIVAAELRYGCAKKGSPRLLAQIEAILDSIQVLALDIPADTEWRNSRRARGRGQTDRPERPVHRSPCLCPGRGACDRQRRRILAHPRP